jgi:hypothetical protein
MFIKISETQTQQEHYLSFAHIESFRIVASEEVWIRTQSGEKVNLRGADARAFMFYLHEVMPKDSVIDLGALYAQKHKIYNTKAELMSEGVLNGLDD